MKRYSTIAMLLLLVAGGCAREKPATLVTEYDEKEMDAAIARARSEVDDFIAELASPTGTNHAVKAPIVDGDETEHFWLIDVSFADGVFTGTIDNQPGIVRNVEMGQKWSVKKDEISDWLFLRDDEMVGNYTMAPLLKAERGGGDAP